MKITAKDAKPGSRLHTLLADRERLSSTLQRIADTVAIGAASRQLTPRIRAIFKAIEDEARDALEGK
mgnify:CR=1 FL=1